MTLLTGAVGYKVFLWVWDGNCRIIRTRRKTIWQKCAFYNSSALQAVAYDYMKHDYLFEW